MSISVSEPPYIHSEPEGFRGETFSIQQAAVTLFFAKEFEATRKRWETYVKDSGVEYLDSWYLSALVLEIDGVPAATIRSLDDIPQYVALDQRRIEETK